MNIIYCTHASFFSPEMHFDSKYIMHWFLCNYSLYFLVTTKKCGPLFQQSRTWWILHNVYYCYFAGEWCIDGGRNKWYQNCWMHYSGVATWDLFSWNGMGGKGTLLFHLKLWTTTELEPFSSFEVTLKVIQIIRIICIFPS